MNFIVTLRFDKNRLRQRSTFSTLSQLSEDALRQDRTEAGPLTVRALHIKLWADPLTVRVLRAQARPCERSTQNFENDSGVRGMRNIFDLHFCNRRYIGLVCFDSQRRQGDSSSEGGGFFISVTAVCWGAVFNYPYLVVVSSTSEDRLQKPPKPMYCSRDVAAASLCLLYFAHRSSVSPYRKTVAFYEKKDPPMTWEKHYSDNDTVSALAVSAGFPHG
ncbi:hypothetical protein Y032_0004g2099 [Ancylostoma ceylanicum]|uniref:Uncharacterized protein n=1 Tax=Ancylostoma ceylanicum TaxID=53326 RepID=A0A016VX25_9BILA|nr:hypothetical protein Y032_0004g2099 [Ancylostoma ceylanicum]